MGIGIGFRVAEVRLELDPTSLALECAAGLG